MDLPQLEAERLKGIIWKLLFLRLRRRYPRGALVFCNEWMSSFVAKAALKCFSVTSLFNKSDTDGALLFSCTCTYFFCPKDVLFSFLLKVEYGSEKQTTTLKAFL